MSLLPGSFCSHPSGAQGFGQGNGFPVSSSVFSEEAITGQPVDTSA
jgi:hypothetical protein